MQSKYLAQNLMEPCRGMLLVLNLITLVCLSWPLVVSQEQKNELCTEHRILNVFWSYFLVLEWGNERAVSPIPTKKVPSRSWEWEFLHCFLSSSVTVGIMPTTVVPGEIDAHCFHSSCSSHLQELHLSICQWHFLKLWCSGPLIPVTLRFALNSLRMCVCVFVVFFSRKIKIWMLFQLNVFIWKIHLFTAYPNE